MAQRASDVIGKPVVSATTGRKLGTVGDLLIDEGGRALTGLVIKHGMLHGEDVLPADAVQSFGRDAVVSRSDVLVGAREWQARHDADRR
jgi:uncharacterized protein YrrD